MDLHISNRRSTAQDKKTTTDQYEVANFNKLERGQISALVNININIFTQGLKYIMGNGTMGIEILGNDILLIAIVVLDAKIIAKSLPVRGLLWSKCRDAEEG